MCTRKGRTPAAPENHLDRLNNAGPNLIPINISQFGDLLLNQVRGHVELNITAPFDSEHGDDGKHKQEAHGHSAGSPGSKIQCVLFSEGIGHFLHQERIRRSGNGCAHAPDTCAVRYAQQGSDLKSLEALPVLLVVAVGDLEDSGKRQLLSTN